MKKLLFVFSATVLMAVFQKAEGQYFHWAKQIRADFAFSTAVDGYGNVYTAGYFNGTDDFDPGAAAFNMTARGYYDAFITKFDIAGNLVWALQFGGTGQDAAYSVAIDSEGNIYTVGYFQDTVDFDPGPAFFNLFAPASNAFIVKLNDAGGLIWAKQLGGVSGSAGARSIVFDSINNFYISGQFAGTVDFDPGLGTFNLTSAGGGDIYTSKFSASGNLKWAKRAGGNSIDTGVSIAVDHSGNVITTGNFETVAFFGGANNLTSAGYNDAFIVKYDSLGNLVWLKQIGGTDTESGACVSADNFGNVYVTGYTGGTVDVDPGSGVYNVTSTPFIVKLNPSGSLIWAKPLVGTVGGSQGEGRVSVLDNLGNIYTTGSFISLVDFDPGPGTLNLTSAGGNDVYISKLDSAGGLVWVKQVGGPTNDFSISLNRDPDGNIYTTGNFWGTVDFDPGPDTFNLTTTGGATYILKLGSEPAYVAKGKIIGDLNEDCNYDTSDVLLSNMLVKAEPGPFYGVSNNTGNYTIYLFDTGSYTISTVRLDTIWQPSCAQSHNIQLTTIPDTTTGLDFTMNASYYCPRLTVELGTPRLRSCGNNTYTFTYSNTGTLPASNSYIEVDFGNHLLPLSSQIPWSTISGNVYTFPIGNLNTNQQGSFNVTAYLNCAADLGSTQCVTAHIYPDSLCLPTPAGWDKSETAVSGTCVNDSLVCFTIKNRSAAGSGDMGGAAQWRLYVNDTLVTQGTYQLAGGDSIVKCFPANGKTYRLEADQNPPHPRRSKPQAIVEACGSPTALGFVNTVPQDDEELAVETFCMQVIGSFDPNDKQVSPIGITSNNYITADDELEYLIRFQNTGTDTAFKVVIRDTIATDVLDIATLTSGASSHDYTFNIYGQGIAEWTFDNILLPDSFVNEPASHGFVQFKIRQLPGNADGTLIENRAAIYFDFNAPVITNTAWNEVNEAGMPVSFLSAAINSATDVATCHGDSTGAVSVSASGGLPPYQFAWSNGATDATATNLLAGNYFITVTDAVENTWTDSVSIPEPTLLEAAITAQTNVLCFGDGTGTAIANATGGTTPYTYEWSNTSGFQTATSLNAGVYSVTVWDAHLCTATTSSITITEPTQLTTLISTQSGVSCFGGNDAAAKANPVGGVAPYTAQWSDGQIGFTANNLSAGNYQITVADSNGCQLITSITIQDGYQVPAGTIAGSDSADINQTATYSVNAGLSYAWSVTNGTILSGQGTNSVEVDWNTIGQGTVEVAVTDSGCTQTVLKTITLVDPTGIENDVLNAIELYPNPTNGTITLKATNINSTAELKLYDSIGKQVVRQNVTAHQLQQEVVFDLKEIDEGIYFFSIKTEEGTRVMKVVKY